MTVAEVALFVFYILLCIGLYVLWKEYRIYKDLRKSLEEQGAKNEVAVEEKGGEETNTVFLKEKWAEKYGNELQKELKAEQQARFEAEERAYKADQRVETYADRVRRLEGEIEARAAERAEKILVRGPRTIRRAALHGLLLDIDREYPPTPFAE